MKQSAAQVVFCQFTESVYTTDVSQCLLKYYVLFRGLNALYIAIPVKNKSMHGVLTVASMGIKVLNLN